MPITVTLNNDAYTTGDGRTHVFGRIAFDSSYLAGGESLTAANLSLAVIDSIRFTPTNGYYFEYIHADSLVRAFKAQSLGVINVNTTAVGNVGVGTDDLITYSVPASTLSANGMGLRVTAYGTTANNANAKTVTLNLGASTIMTQALTASIAGSWWINGTIVRTAVDAQDCIASLTQGATDIAHAEFTATTIDDGAAIIVKCTGAATSDNDVVQEGLVVELFAPQGTGATGVQVPGAADLSGLTGVRFHAIGV